MLNSKIALIAALAVDTNKVLAVEYGYVIRLVHRHNGVLVLTSLLVAARQASMVAKLPSLRHNIVTTMNTIKHS